jgi:hypothetical protein
MLMDLSVPRTATFRSSVGFGWIVGDPARPGRRDEREFVRELKRMIGAKADVVVLHHGPDTQRGELRGHPEVRGSAQALNVDSRVVVLTRAT